MKKIKRIDLTVTPVRGKPVTVSMDAAKAGDQWTVFEVLGGMVLEPEGKRARRKK